MKTCKVAGMILASVLAIAPVAFGGGLGASIFPTADSMKVAMLPAVKSRGLILAFRRTSMRRRIDPAPAFGILPHIGGVIHLVSPSSIRNDER
jgi:hypothetical protein